MAASKDAHERTEVPVPFQHITETTRAESYTTVAFFTTTHSPETAHGI